MPAREGPRPEPEVVSLEVDGRVIPARHGDTLAMAMFKAGILMTSRSPKYRRPRGAYCLEGDCGTCLVRVDGRPNQRACTTRVRAGMKVEFQNEVRPLGPLRVDPTSLIDRLFRGGIDHHHLMVRPRIVNQIMQGVARELTGLGELPSHGSVSEDTPSRHEHRRVAVLVVGGGPAGRAAAEQFEQAGVEVMVVDRHPSTHLAIDPYSPARATVSAVVETRTAVFAAYPQESLWVALQEGALAGAVLLTIEAQHVLLATGCREPVFVCPNNDLPGVFAARGLLRSLRECGARLRGPCVVIGDGYEAERCRVALGSLLDPEAPEVVRVTEAEVEGLRGVAHVEAVATADALLPAAVVAFAGALSPAHELVAQAGGELRWTGQGYAPRRDERGWVVACGRSQVWACGELCAVDLPDRIDPAGAREAICEDARRVAASIAEYLAREAAETPGASS